jgi:alkylation response protein AidB-like acyl-CoA dehydrogenase
MANLLVDERDVAFVLFEQLNIDRLCSHACYEECSSDVFEMALSEAQKLSVNEIWPTNQIGDRQGCIRDGNEVKVPEAFHKIWKLFIEGGWLTISESPDVGGQGMPHVLGIACNEYFVAANPAFATFSGLTQGAARLIENFGTPEQKEKYMYRMWAGEWAGTMCLTEPQAGSDLGILRAKAKLNPDGMYTITGNKIFITDGNHDLTENIIHAVLARIEGAPAGTKGISLFIVPKYRVNDDGTLSEFNDVAVGALEHKMGINGSPTCALNFGEEGLCKGELLGEENRGLSHMFQMMNEERIGVGLQGLGTASTAYLHALDYAKERLQGVDVKEFRNPEAPRVPIIHHPDVRRMLMLMKCLVEGIRGMIYFTAYCMDRVKVASDDAERVKWQGFADLLTPVVKAYGSDLSLRVVDTAMQVYGGYGYIKEYPIEQFMRDVKIASIYEGTNGIQALDLVARKLSLNKGMVFISLLGEISQFVESAKDHAALGDDISRLETAKNELAQAAMFFASKAKEDLNIPLLYACPFLDLLGEVVVGWQLLWQATLAHENLLSLYRERGAQTPEAKGELIQQSRDAAYYAGKVAAAKFFSNTFLTLSPAKSHAIRSGDTSAMEIPEAGFASM